MKNRRRKYYNPWVVFLATAFFAALYLAVLRPWMNRWGVAAAEATMPLPGDEAVAGVVPTSTRGIVIHAPANQVWQWVVQLGQERAGFYSNDWLENLTFADIHNANEIRPDWQQRKQGDIVLGAGGAVYGENSYWHIPYYERGKSSICGDRSLWIPSTTEPHTCSSAPMPRPHRPRYMPLMYSRMTGSIS